MKKNFNKEVLFYYRMNLPSIKAKGTGPLRLIGLLFFIIFPIFSFVIILYSIIIPESNSIFIFPEVSSIIL